MRRQKPVWTASSPWPAAESLPSLQSISLLHFAARKIPHPPSGCRKCNHSLWTCQHQKQRVTVEQAAPWTGGQHPITLMMGAQLLQHKGMGAGAAHWFPSLDAGKVCDKHSVPHQDLLWPLGNHLSCPVPSRPVRSRPIPSHPHSCLEKVWIPQPRRH